uniref:Teratocyte lectin c-type domain n=1 Tax=Cotesia flavipes TaxID=89805 RepID=A0A8K1YTW3_COTFL|nr:teratocyte lectin c-type domain [Cotesia flavipes]
MCRMFLFLVIQLFVGLYAQRDKKFFRKDYKYIEETDSFYKIHTIHRTWQDAKATCEMEGATFFYPEDETEANAVIDFLKKTQPFEWVYVGISDLLVKGVFETIDNIPVVDVYNKWDAGEPNDLDGNEDCVNLRRNGFLNDDKCDKKYPFICKKKRSMLEWNQFCYIPNMDYNYNENLGKCYKFHLKPRTWPDAYVICNAEQSYLAVIDSPAEANYLKELTDKTSKDNIRGDYLKGAVLLGFHNRSGDGWKTIKGSPLEDSGYSNWGNQQPDGGDNEKCGSMFYNGRLNDINCSTKAFFICEHDVDILGSIFDERNGN